jgi:hypothetical protein
MTKILLPARSELRIKKTYSVINVWGWGLKDSIRHQAKKSPLYHREIEISPAVTGRTDSGIPIEINTLGKWLFGTPGYKSNLVIESFEPQVTVRLPDVREAIDLIDAAVNALPQQNITCPFCRASVPCVPFALEEHIQSCVARR